MSLSAQKREITGKKVKRLRLDSQIPASLYGATRNPSISLTLAKKELLSAIKEFGYSKVLELKVEGEAKPVNVVFKEIQTDPVYGGLVHVSLHQIEMDKEITADIPLILSGISLAVKNNLGLLVTPLDKISVACLPSALPSSIEVSISNLNDVGDVLSVDKITLPAGVKIGHGTPHDAVIAYISAPQKIEEVVEVAPVEGAPVEGEVPVEGAEPTTEETSGKSEKK